MEANKNITVIVPVHQLAETDKTDLVRALNSVPKGGYPVIIVCPKSIKNDIDVVAKDYAGTTVKCATGEPSFAAMVNEAVADVKTEYFSILEMDDEYTPIWFENVEKYVKYNPEVSIYIPMLDILNYKDGRFMTFGNEAPWASNFSDEVGVIDFNSLENYYNFSLTGSVFNKADWESTGGIKGNIKLTFWFELMKRYTYKEKKLFVIPKIGYRHYIMRPGALFVQYQGNMDEKESEYWFKVANDEYYYTEERPVEAYVKTDA